MSLTVCEPMPKKAQRTEAKGQKKEVPVSTKLYPSDNEMLADLAGEKGMSVAEFFSDTFGAGLSDLYADYLDRKKEALAARRQQFNN